MRARGYSLSLVATPVRKEGNWTEGILRQDSKKKYPFPFLKETI
jgi:hypothetical protein